MSIYERLKDLPYVATQTAEFYNRPGSLLTTPEQHRQVARGDFGVELLSYDLVRAGFRHRGLRGRTEQYFVDKGATPLIQEYVANGTLSFMSDEKHARLRPILTKGFAPRRIAAAQEMMRGIAERLVDDLAGRTECNIVADFSHHFTIRSIAAFIGVPAEDVPIFDQATVNFRLLGQVPMAPGIPVLEASLKTVSAYVRDLVDQRRRNPKEDLISALVEAQESGDRLSEPELIWVITNVLNAGHDTTRYQMASCVRAAVEGGAWDAIAADPSLIRATINEAMRLYPATPKAIKIASEDLDVGGVPFSKGEVVVLNLSAAGRDPNVFADPDRFDLDRPQPLYDIGFGYGAHYCIGHALASAEMTEGLSVLTRRLRDLEITGPIQLKPTGIICGPEVIPLRYRAR